MTILPMVFVNNFPLIAVLFYRTSILITGILLIHTLIGSVIKGLQSQPPIFVTFIAGTIIRNKIGELVFAGDYMEVEYKVQ